MSKTREEPDGFTEFWTIWRKYARHTDGRGLARDAFIKHVRARADPQDIIDGATHFFRTMKDKDREFVPLSATWLNREAYSDLAAMERAYQLRIGAGNSNQQSSVRESAIRAAIESNSIPWEPSEREKYFEAKRQANGGGK